MLEKLSLEDVQNLRKKPIIGKISICVKESDILNAKKHLEKLFIGKVTFTFAQKILILDLIYNS